MNNFGLVFNIQQFSLHDGPGIRTIVFFKGCPLRCRWCANPESQYDQPELVYNKNKCIGTHECRECLQACGAGAIEQEERHNKVVLNRKLCLNCGECAKVCPSKALEILGKTMSVNEVLKIAQEDGVFYSRSGGGLTLSGGEPLLQAEFACGLLREAKNKGMDTAIETCGYTRWQNIEKACQYVNTVFYDIKCINSDKHKRFTNVSNKRILQNFKDLCGCFPQTPVIVRTPVVPGFNDREEDILEIINFIKGNPNVKYELLPYHRFGESKYAYLGKNYLLRGVPTLTEEHIKFLRNIVNRYMGER
ncbi:pyruvate formate-lyase activating enzyme [Desulfocucumis palustris]|uniref:Pyruvate formate-lyase activating enzyme n=1 Tax=Desulfocucumis palustris TaxID=1898651 RepID=A0A2L2XI66_9FIRM|nr:glycyl-radical enzyme activating protein [Desulfocucumis palustris]GBF33936.1 pyruvate formate-lyase activating enzyme [Desulfocucumis palustris]